jgi:tRNA U34 5-carboxymethylaminomethyl modifying GTPase MnmE/TrmE
LNDIKNTVSEKFSLDIISEQIRFCIWDMDNLTGTNLSDELLDSIFEKFCIGK